MNTEQEKRLHDFESALQTLRRGIESLEKGYRFDDSLAGAKMNALKKALNVLEKEAPTWRAAFQKDNPT